MPRTRAKRQRRKSRQCSAIDTVSHNVTLRGLVLEYLHQTAMDISVPESEVCWFLDTGHPISPTLNLAYSSSLSSRECTASVLLNYVAIAFEHALHLEFGACSLLSCSCGALLSAQNWPKTTLVPSQYAAIQLTAKESILQSVAAVTSRSPRTCRLYWHGLSLKCP